MKISQTHASGYRVTHYKGLPFNLMRKNLHLHYTSNVKLFWAHLYLLDKKMEQFVLLYSRFFSILLSFKNSTLYNESPCM